VELVAGQIAAESARRLQQLQKMLSNPRIALKLQMARCLPNWWD